MWPRLQKQTRLGIARPQRKLMRLRSAKEDCRARERAMQGTQALAGAWACLELGGRMQGIKRCNCWI